MKCDKCSCESVSFVSVVETGGRMRQVSLCQFHYHLDEIRKITARTISRNRKMDIAMSVLVSILIAIMFLIICIKLAVL